MARFAPLAVTVEIALGSGPAAGERRFRLSHEIVAPDGIRFSSSLPIEGEGEARARFSLPGGQEIEAAAVVHFDPEHPERGSSLRLLGLVSAEIEAILDYIETRNET